MSSLPTIETELFETVVGSDGGHMADFVLFADYSLVAAWGTVAFRKEFRAKHGAGRGTELAVGKGWFVPASGNILTATSTELPHPDFRTIELCHYELAAIRFVHASIDRKIF